jgi:hypothetical protein
MPYREHGGAQKGRSALRCPPFFAFSFVNMQKQCAPQNESETTSAACRYKLDSDKSKCRIPFVWIFVLKRHRAGFFSGNPSCISLLSVVKERVVEAKGQYVIASAGPELPAFAPQITRHGSLIRKHDALHAGAVGDHNCGSNGSRSECLRSVSIV